MPPNWNGQRFRPDSREEQFWYDQLPRKLEKNAADSALCNIYFLEPNFDQMQSLQRLASMNTESPAKLLLEYFRYFAWMFDYRHSVVSIHRNGDVIEKIEKYERTAWMHSDNLSIEDPFEIFYDVAHVIKPTQMTYIRKEFLVS